MIDSSETQSLEKGNKKEHILHRINGRVNGLYENFTLAWFWYIDAVANLWSRARLRDYDGLHVARDYKCV